jgi:hypothetical protein
VMPESAPAAASESVDVDTSTKRCSKCMVSREKSCFRASKGRGGYRGQCKACEREVRLKAVVDKQTKLKQLFWTSRN